LEWHALPGLGRISPHTVETRKRLTQERVVEGTRCLKVCLLAIGLP